MEKHSKSSLLLSLPLTFIILFSHSARAETQFDVYVPLRATPIRDIELFVDLPLATSGDVTFRVARTSTSAPVSKNFIVDSSVGSPDIVRRYIYDEPAASATNPPDTVTISAHSAPVTKRFKIYMQLDTNWSNESGSCVNRQSGTETWHIETLANGVPTAPAISAACVNSYEINAATANCDLILEPTTDNPAAIINATAISTITYCTDDPPPVPEPPTLLR